MLPIGGITEEIIVTNTNQALNESDYQRMITNLISCFNAELDINPSQFSEIPGAAAFFKQIKTDKNLAVGIATGAWEQSALIKLNAIGIDPPEVSFCNSNYYKSRADITQDVIRQLKNKTRIAPDKIIYFGDGVWDYKTCQELGIDFIGIDYHQDGKLKGLGVDRVFVDYADGVALLRIIRT